MERHKMYIEDLLNQKNTKPVEKVGFELDREFTRKIVGSKTQVFQRLVGCVFIGSNGEASQYVAQQRAKQAIKNAEKALRPNRWMTFNRGQNPLVTR